ncbi:M24 family metallopeptidase [Blastococcus sp. MG754426]|uniref:M24 family metallopeptidase n=1 Tax=unclassified Blastococcus TaxID=2619396 RepID=UPI001EF0E973|nr:MULTISPECIES: M24 family metallopeptidase [unclassified Blastococcus]MCF6506969.1 M24 family metallopeptidase [Blastococcus sp. MG754426]MCF6511002.1 M24 family metallopeptidase [Blastococcus sp. MG754427]MCF6734404.1 M24 family metallopeptidase [Blastococcus sp. KM273129]
MSLVAPGPTRTVPPPLRVQADVRDRWLTQRLLDVLPGLMDRAGIDLWIVAGREYNEDPVLATLLPASWLSARRRTILLLHRSDDGVTPAAVSRYPVGQFLPAWTTGEGAGGGQWAEVRRFVEQADPRRIGIDVSEDFALADGLSHTEHRLLTEALGPYAERLVSAERLAVSWLETRLPEEIDALRGMNLLAHQVIAEAFSPAVVRVGETTALDVAWWIRQRLHDLGVEPWFQPSVLLQRAGVPLAEEGGTLLPAVPADAEVLPGDLLHCDVGLSCLGLRTDTQRNAYVLRPGETDAPAGLRAALAAANRLQDLTTAALVPGRTGNEVLAAARAAAADEGLDGDVYSHPIGYHGHGAGPAIGQWDQQQGVPGAGDHPVHLDTAYALELAVRRTVPEWGGQCVRLGLEEGIALTGDGVEYLDGRQTGFLLIG